MLQPKLRGTTRAAATKNGHAIVVEDLRKIYTSRRRDDVAAVDGVSFSVGHGEVVGLLGANGAGKTTSIKCMCTLIRPTSGKVAVEGIDVIRRPLKAVANISAVLEGNRNIYWRLTVKENLYYFAALHGLRERDVRDLAVELIERFGLADKRDTVAQHLSRGMQQKLAVACAFIKQTPVLFLDEPTLGLDVETSKELRGQLRAMASEGGYTILISSHDMDVVQDVCERVIIIKEGKVVTDDKVSNLLELFKARAYQFTLAGSLTPAQQDSLRNRFPMIEMQTTDGASTIRVELLDGAGFYELVDILRTEKNQIESIDKLDPDLEEVFLEIVKGEASPP